MAYAARPFPGVRSRVELKPPKSWPEILESTLVQLTTALLES